MGNCLVTKLKGAVDNSNLLRIGEGCFEVMENKTANTIITAAKSPITIRKKDGSAFNAVANGETKTGVTSVYGNAITLSDAGIYVIDDKYKVTAVNSQRLYNSYPDTFDYSPLYSLNVTYGVALIDKLPKYKDTLKELIYTNVSLSENNLSYISVLTNLQTLQLSTLLGVSLTTGTFGSFIPASVTTFRGGDGYMSGSIEDFVAARRAAGVTEGSLSMAWLGDGVTFNGNAVGIATKTLSWTGSTITFGGETINA